MCSSSRMRVEGFRWPSHDLALRRLEQAGARLCNWVQVLLELQRDWTRHATYDAARAIVVANGGGYGMGLAYAREMIHPACAGRGVQAQGRRGEAAVAISFNGNPEQRHFRGFRLRGGYARAAFRRYSLVSLGARRRKHSSALCQNCVTCPSKPGANMMVCGDPLMQIVVARCR